MIRRQLLKTALPTVDLSQYLFSAQFEHTQKAVRKQEAEEHYRRAIMIRHADLCEKLFRTERNEQEYDSKYENVPPSIRINVPLPFGMNSTYRYEAPI